MTQRAHRVVKQPHLDARPGLRGEDLLQAPGEGIGAPDEVLEMDRVPGGLHVLDQARVKLRRVLLDFHTVAPGQRGMGIAPDEHHQLSAAGALAFEPGDHLILARQHGRQNGKSTRLEILPEELALLAEGFPVPAEQKVDQYADSRCEEESEHPRQGFLRSSVLRNEEYTRDERVEGKRCSQDRADVAHRVSVLWLRRTRRRVSIREKSSSI